MVSKLALYTGRTVMGNITPNFYEDSLTREEYLKLREEDAKRIRTRNRIVTQSSSNRNTKMVN